MNAPLLSTDIGAEGALQVFAFFHLNLAFSSIEEERRGEVIARCYWPLLQLAERAGPIGMELSGYTLEEIAARSPTEREKLIDATRLFYLRNSAIEKTGNKRFKAQSRVYDMPVRELVKQLQQMILASPMYGVYVNPDRGRILRRLYLALPPNGLAGYVRTEIQKVREEVANGK